jgi:hypothetical protein
VPRRLTFLLAFAAVALAAVIGALPASAQVVPDPPAAAVPGPVPANFWLASTAGDVWNFGKAGAYGSLAGVPLTKPIVGITPTPSGKGYWLVATDGGIFAFGDAGFFGSTGAIRLNKPIVGMAATTTGNGYWLVASDGGIFAYGDAEFFGSTGAFRLNKPIVGMSATPTGKGYWLVASDGGIFAFGDAGFFGSTGAIRLNQPIVGMASAKKAKGYWLLAADGGIFAFGDSAFHGSTGGSPSPDPAQKVVAGAKDGYWIVNQNGTVVPFGDVVGAPPVQGLMFQPVTAGDRAALFAFAQLGKPYIWGGNGPVGYDCSGLVLAAWKSAGKSFARVANDQYHTAGAAVPLPDLQTGDLVFWGSSQDDWSTVYHAGMYVGGGRIVESTGDHVQLNTLGQWGWDDLMPHAVRP